MPEKKIKSSAERITLPEDAKERIISKCAEIEKAERNGNADYTDHVFTVERVKSHRIRRIVSGIAACAVIVGGIGVTGTLLHKNGGISIASEIADKTSNRISPFGDFNELEYFIIADDGLNGQYSEKTYKEITDYLNNFDWGEETDGAPPETEIKTYILSWQIGKEEYFLGIREDDLAVYYKFPESDTSGDMIYDFMKCYSIDFKKFEEGLKKIIEPACDDSLMKIREEFKEIIGLPAENDSFTAKLVYDTADKDMRPEELSDDTIELSDELLEKFEAWVYANSYELSKKQTISHMAGRKSPQFGKVYFDVNIYKDNNLTYQFSFLEDGYFLYTQYQMLDIDGMVIPHECKRLCFKGDGMATLNALVSEDLTGSLKEKQNQIKESDELTNPNTPFGDFTKRSYTLVDYANYREDGYTKLEYEEISKFLNSFAWGEELHTTDHEGDGEIVISWPGEEPDSVYVLGIRKNGTAIYYKRQPTDNEPYAKAFERYFSVDYNNFREGLEKNIENSTPAVDSGQAWRDGITINLLNKSYEPYYYGDYGEKTAMNMAMRYAVCDSISNAEWTEKQITDEEQVINNSVFCVSCYFPESDNTIYIYGLEDDTIAFRTDTNKDNIFYRCFKGDVQAMKEAVEMAMDTESQHTEDNAAYYLPGFNFVKAYPLYIDPENGEQPLSEDACSKLQDIFYGYNWNTHEVDNIDSDNLVPAFKFVVKSGDFERHLDVCRDGFISLYDTDSNGNKLGTGNSTNDNVNIVYKFDYDTIENKVLQIMENRRAYSK